MIRTHARLRTHRQTGKPGPKVSARLLYDTRKMQIPGRSSGDHISAAQLAQAAQLAVVPRGGASRGGGRRPKAKFTADPSIEEVECEYDSQTNGILVQSMAAAQWAELYIYICMYVPSPGVSKGPGRRGIGCPETHGLAARFLLTDPGDGHRNRSLNRDRRRGGGQASCRVVSGCGVCPLSAPKRGREQGGGRTGPVWEWGLTGGRPKPRQYYYFYYLRRLLDSSSQGANSQSRGHCQSKSQAMSGLLDPTKPVSGMDFEFRQRGTPTNHLTRFSGGRQGCEGSKGTECSPTRDPEFPGH